jgi:hypothetical protein
MATFANAFNNITNKTVTENGAVVENTSGNPILDFSHKIVRNSKQDEIKSRIYDIMAYINKTGKVEDLHDLFVLMFHKRNPRGGEGEKAIVYSMMLELYEYYPKTIINMVSLLGDFGYYKDFYLIWEVIYTKVVEYLKPITIDSEVKAAQKFYSEKYSPLINEIIRYSIYQRNVDLETLKQHDKSISLIGKWIPREKSHFGKKVFWFVIQNGNVHIKSVIDMLVIELAKQSGVNLNVAYSIPTYWYKKYRAGNVILNSKLDVPEIKMCASMYSDIKLEQVASKAMLQYRKAFMNEKLKEKPKQHQENTGNRFPNVLDRVTVRKNYKELLESKSFNKFKSATLEPHEITNKLMDSTLSTMDNQALVALWESKKLDVKKHLEEMLNHIKENGGNMGNNPYPNKLIPIVDVSESMTQSQNPRPLDVAIALGIMTAELHEDDSPFKDMIMSFTDIPKFYKFSKETSLLDRIKQVNSYKGYNTNFRLAMEELLKLCITNRVIEDDIPDLIVFTDGQFDSWGPRSMYTQTQPQGQWNTHHKELVKMWSKAGYSKMPRIIYWNLRGGTPGVQTDLNHNGVQMLQGFSPNLIKFVLYGESFDSVNTTFDIDGKKVTMKVSSVTPWETFRAIIDQSRYDCVRAILHESNEKLLEKYTFISPDTPTSTPTSTPDTSTPNTPTPTPTPTPETQTPTPETLETLDTPKIKLTDNTMIVIDNGYEIL